MGRKVLISFLGTNNYIPCNYYLEEGEITAKTRNVRFVQEAVIEQCCKKFDKNDQIYVFVTEEAKEKNWLDNGHIDWKTKEVIPSEGLKTRLDKSNTKAQIQQHRILAGIDRNEIWKIFSKVAEQIEDNDTIFFDITYGFRSLPMLGIVLINYAKALHNITVGGIYYGAFEYLGTAVEARKMPIEERNAPILNLTQFAELQEWALATSIFSKYGITKLIAEQTRQQREYFDKRGEGNLLNQFATHIDNLFLNFSTVRGENIFRGEDHKRLSKSVAEIAQSETITQDIPPLKGILEKVDDDLQKMTGTDNLDRGIKAVEWMIDNGLIQQGITLIRELVVYYCMDAYSFNWEDHREEELNRFFSYIMNGKSHSTIQKRLKTYDIESRIYDEDLHPVIYDMKRAIQGDFQIIYDFSKVLKRIKKYRDNMNHGALGIRQNNIVKNTREFKKALQEANQNLKTLIKKYNLNAN